MHFRLTILIGTAGATTSAGDAVDALTVGREVRVEDTAADWPFRRVVTPARAADTIVIPALHHAFPAGQTGPARLVLTQATYQLQRWLDWLDAHPRTRAIGVLAQPSPYVRREADAKRGPWSRVDMREVTADACPAPADHPLYAAFAQPDPEVRYEACRRAVHDGGADAAARLALASAGMETGRLDEAEAALDLAATLAADWEAVHFERGKLYLWRDDTERAAAAFAAAARLMPTFAAAHANLGAALGELERPDEALAALEQALRLDPFGHAVHNNVGASLRDLGRLTDAEASFRTVTALAPDFVFGHYNLGHVLFLQGRFADACRAYEDGLARDPKQTPRQRLRLALAAAALDDDTGVPHARAALEATPDDRKTDLLDEMTEGLEALTALRGERRPAVAALEQLVAGYRATLRS